MNPTESEHHRLARLIPLMRVASLRVLETILTSATPQWDGQFANDFVKGKQQACGWKPCVYFYAGQAHPKYGDVAFAYTPAYERNKTGLTAPCDTGGIYAGRCEPFHGKSGTDEVVAFLQKIQVNLADWREGFADYLYDFFGENVHDYCMRRPPNTHETARWGEPDLPARFPANHLADDWPSWTWEVRIEERTALYDELLTWSTSQTTEAQLVDRMTRRGSGMSAAPYPSKLLRITRQIDSEFTESVNRLQEWVADWLTHQP